MGEAVAAVGVEGDHVDRDHDPHERERGVETVLDGEGGVGPRVLLPRVRVGVQDAFCSGPSSACCSRAAISRSAFSRSAFSRSACLAFSLSSSFALLA